MTKQIYSQKMVENILIRLGLGRRLVTGEFVAGTAFIGINNHEYIVYTQSMSKKELEKEFSHASNVTVRKTGKIVAKTAQ